MISMKNMRVSTKLHLLVALSVLGLALVGGASYMEINAVKVGGPIHAEIGFFNDLEADILPPALNIERVRFAVIFLLSDRDRPENLTQDMALFQERKREYVDANEAWKKRIPDGSLRELTSSEAYGAGMQYIKTVEEELIPAVQRRNEKAVIEARGNAVASAKKCTDATARIVQIVQAKRADLAEGAKKRVARSQLFLAALGILIAAVVGIMGLRIGRSVSAGTTSALALANAIAECDLTMDDLEAEGKDELADMARALNNMRTNLHRVVQSITENAQQVAGASEELSSTSQQISANSEETSAQANVVSAATQNVSQNLQSVSAGAEQMTTTIQSIASNAHEAAAIASRAVQTAQAANTTIEKLGVSSTEIGEVIKVITSIAQQTKLLALNATIEAARAGEAGKGFAVVANEVKELARQTAKATEDISHKIVAIQSDTNGAVEAIGSITGVIHQINDISSAIATAVEEQSATTNEMTRNVAEAAKGSGDITQNIVGVAEAAQGTSTSAQESQRAANELADLAARLRELVDQFKVSSGNSGGASAKGTDRQKHMAAHA